jgi:hypothetical protein
MNNFMSVDQLTYLLQFGYVSHCGMESLFGPPSEFVDIPAFIESALHEYSGDLDSVQLPTENIAEYR